MLLGWDVIIKEGDNLYMEEGFVEEGVLRKAVKVGGKLETLVLMSILKSEYRK
jgi:RimJ/RimL family protein N-acetyltransferase